tara:strand:- start:484 stop:1002 length:519 start_codon:yes stop_codon:yes gene_type:complete
MAKALELFRRVAYALTTFGTAVASGALCIIVAAYCYEVVSRYFFSHPTLWASDLVAFLLFLSIFLMIPEVARSGGHVRVTVLEDRLCERRRDRLWTVLALVSALACFVAAWISGLENVRQFFFEITTVSVYPIPKWVLSWTVTYGFGLSGVHFLIIFLSPAGSVDSKTGGFT